MATFRCEPSDRSLTISPTASEDEAAAIVAAIGRVLAASRDESDETEDSSVDPWMRTARFEAVSSFSGRPPPDMPADPWIAMGRTRR